MTKYTELRRLAEAATPGDGRAVFVSLTEPRLSLTKAADPQTIIALLDRIEELEYAVNDHYPREVTE